MNNVLITFIEWLEYKKDMRAAYAGARKIKKDLEREFRHINYEVNRECERECVANRECRQHNFSTSCNVARVRPIKIRQ